jgi:uncharacterized protein YjeT (DUF2065 family)
VGDFIAAIGLVLVIEGVFYCALPGLAKRVAAEAAGAPENTLRLAGLAAVALGVGVVWLARG